MVSDEKIDRLKKAIGLDFENTHVQMNKPVQTAQPVSTRPEIQSQPIQQTPPVPTTIPKEKTQAMPQSQVKTNDMLSNITRTEPQTVPHIHNIPAQNRTTQQEPHITPIQTPYKEKPETKHIQTVGNLARPAERPIKNDSSSAPLFVKIDKHIEITDKIKETSNELKKIVETISLLGKAEKLKTEAIEKIEKRLNLFDESLNKIDNNLVEPKEFSSHSIIPLKEQGNTELETLQTEITKLKNELNNL